MPVTKLQSSDAYPKQERYLNKRVNVCFGYNTSNLYPGIVIRDDADEPYLTVIKLDDGRVVLSWECQYQPLD